VLKCHSWHQAQNCMALARLSDDPALKQYYLELALEFVRNAGSERDLELLAASLATIKPKPDGGNTDPHK
jgi:hypothetical protein